MRKKLTVLFLAADPFKDKARLELGDEMRAIDQAIQRGSARDAVELVAHFGTRTRDLHQALLRHQPQIVHFAGHGAQPGVLYLGDEYGRPKAVGGEALGRLFGILKGEVRAVVLNGCHTLGVVEELAGVVDYAIGTNRKISDGSAIHFAEAFYTALAFGRGVRQAFDLAVNQLQLEGSGEADVPVLRVRPGTDAVPLVAAVDAEERHPAPRSGDVDLSVKLGDVEEGQLNVIGDDQHAAAPVGGNVRTNFEAGSIKGGKFNIVGRRIGGPAPEE